MYVVGGEETTGGNFLILLGATGVLTQSSPVLSVGDVGVKFASVFLLASSVSEKVTWMSPELFTRGLECRVRLLSLSPLQHTCKFFEDRSARRAVEAYHIPFEDDALLPPK